MNNLNVIIVEILLFHLELKHNQLQFLDKEKSIEFIFFLLL